MASSAAKFVPVGVVAGAIGYFCWPYLADLSASAPSKKSVEEEQLTAEMLAPPAFSSLERDPFGIVAADQKPTQPPDGNAASPSRILAAIAKADAAPRRSSTPAVAAPSTLVLHGTYVRGNHRVALINHAVYSEGDQIALDEQTGAICRVAKIDLDKVVLDLNGETAELSYPIFLSPPAVLPTPSPMEDAAVPIATVDDSPHEIR